jgi:CRISPR-associated protein (TIGR02584 family)
MAKVHLILGLGKSPGILTETVWWYARRGDEITGIEAWTTAEGARALATFVTETRWIALEEATGAKLPARPERWGVPPSEVGAGFSVVTFVDAEGTPLSDIRTRSDADAVAAQLYDRLNDLRRRLSDDVWLRGSVAGGRKSMGSALQTAFVLHARPCDHLVHVLLHPEIERRAASFAFPGDGSVDLDVPHEAQVDLYEVPFPRLRTLLDSPLARKANLSRLLDGSYRDLWEPRSADVRAELRLRRHPGGSKWTLALSDGLELDLNLSQGALLAAIVRAGRDGLAQKDLPERMAALHREASVTDENARKVLQALRNRMDGLPIEFRGQFTPIVTAGATRVPGFASITITGLGG